jgi:hypothetical protein
LHPHLLSDFTQMVFSFRHHTMHILYPFEQAIYLFYQFINLIPLKENLVEFLLYRILHKILSHYFLHKPYHNITSSPQDSFGHTTSSFNFLH